MRALVSELNKNKASYAITGALAASYYGTPRTTADIDILLQFSATNRDRLLRILEEMGLKVNRTRIKRQLDAGYNVVTLHDKHSPQQADFIIQPKGRLVRQEGTFLGLKAYYQTPESLILAKLRMIKATRPRERSIKDREDIKAILQNTKVNVPKIIKGARKETTLEIARTLVPYKSLRDLRGAFKDHEKLIKQSIKELGREHREETGS